VVNPQEGGIAGLIFGGKNQFDNPVFYQKCSYCFVFFDRSLPKSRRTAKSPTVLNILLHMLTIPINLRNIYFQTNFRIFQMHSIKLENSQVCTSCREERGAEATTR